MFILLLMKKKQRCTLQDITCGAYEAKIINIALVK